MMKVIVNEESLQFSRILRGLIHMIEMNDRLMLYIDILGFSDFMKNTRDDILKQKLSSYENIFKAYNKEEYFKEIIQTDPMVKRMFPNVTTYEDNPESSVFSDSILFSYEEYMPYELLQDTPDHFRGAIRKRTIATFIHKACEIQRDILSSLGLLVRGVIHIGPLHHEGHLIIGKGFIEAFELEKKKKNPAIFLSDEVYKRWQAEIDIELKKDKQHTFYRKEGNDIYIFPAYLLSEKNKQEVYTLIRNGLDQAPCGARQKWEWMQTELRSYHSAVSMNIIKNFQTKALSRLRNVFVSCRSLFKKDKTH